MKRKFTEKDYQDWIRLYQEEGKSLNDIARQYRCDISTVYQTFRRRGVKFRRTVRPVTTKEVALWTRVYIETGSLGEVLSVANRNESTVLRHLVAKLRELLLSREKL